MKEKKAFVGAMFGAMEAADGIKNTGKAYKDTRNKYDDLMGTRLVKATNKMGLQNASLAGSNSRDITNNIINSNAINSIGVSNNKKTASEKIDYLYKEAGIRDRVVAMGPKIKNAIPTAKRMIDNFDARNTAHLVAAKDAFKNKEVLRGINHSVKAAPGTALGAGMIVGSGVGTTKLLKKLDNSNDARNDVEYNTIGGAITAGMALNALSKKRMLAPASTALGMLAAHATKVPGNVVKKTPVGQAFNMAGQGLKATAAQTNKINSDINFIGSNIDKLLDSGKTFSEAKDLIVDRQLNNLKTQHWQLSKTDPQKLQELLEARKGELEHAFGVVADLVNKKASEKLDDLYKVAGTKTDYLNHVIKNRFFKPGFESLPYYAGTAMIGLAVDKKNQKRQKDIELYNAYQKAIKDKKQSNTEAPVPEKVASAQTVFLKNPKIDGLIRQSLESAVEGVGRMAVPLAASTLIGRDFTNSFRKVRRNKLDGENNLAPDEASIQLSRRDRREMLKQIGNVDTTKAASEDEQEEEEQEQQPKEKGTSEDSAQNVLDTVRDIEKGVIGAREVLQGDRVHIGNGVKKQFRLNPMHNMHGMTE